jgi:hypothetical protein
MITFGFKIVCVFHVECRSCKDAIMQKLEIEQQIKYRGAMEHCVSFKRSLGPWFNFTQTAQLAKQTWPALRLRIQQPTSRRDNSRCQFGLWTAQNGREHDGLSDSRGSLWA